MPHLVVSYAKEVKKQVKIKKLIKEVWEGAYESGLFNPTDVKVRALPIKDFITGGSDKPFIHIDFMLYEGRTDEQKKHMNKCVMDRLLALVSEDVALSILPVDMDKENYAKRG